MDFFNNHFRLNSNFEVLKGKMEERANLFLIGGSGRNVGKTTFACLLIETLSKKNDVIGLKISNIKPDDSALHGFHENELQSNFEIFEEKGDGDKDSQRMLNAGALKSFFIRTNDAFAEEAFNSLLKQTDKQSLIVCESNSLRKYVKPKAFVMVGDIEQSKKPGAKAVFEMADFVVGAMDLPKFEEVVDVLAKY